MQDVVGDLASPVDWIGAQQWMNVTPDGQRRQSKPPVCGTVEHLGGVLGKVDEDDVGVVDANSCSQQVDVLVPATLTHQQHVPGQCSRTRFHSSVSGATDVISDRLGETVK